MTPEQQVAYVQSQTACMLAELEAMKAENEFRAKCGETRCYRPEDFRELAGRFNIHHNQVIGLFHDLT